MFKRARIVVFLFVATLFFNDAGKATAQTIQWQHSMTAVVEQAQASNRPILVFVTADWCRFCKKMERETWSDANLAAPVSSHFETVLLESGRNQETIDRLNVNSFPTTLVFAADGSFIDQHAGFMTAAQTTRWLQSALRSDQIANR